MSGNAPINTNPILISDEMISVRARGDFWNLANSSEQLAAGSDGVFAPSAQWTLTSASIDFQSQGVAPQNMILLTTPKTVFPGSGRAFAIDAVVGNQLTLRVTMKNPGVGQPPAPIAGLTGVTFNISTLSALAEDASWDTKSRFAIDEFQPFRASSWMYQGAEDLYRDLRALVVLKVLRMAFQAEVRADRGDWALKLKRVDKEYDEVLARVQVRWGPYGNSAEPSNPLACKISR